MNDSASTDTYITNLREQIRKLRVELLYLLNQWYHLKQTVYPEITHQYKSHFGDLEFDLDDKRTVANNMDERVRKIVSRIRSNQVVPKAFVVNTYNLNFQKEKFNSVNADTRDIFEIITSEYETKLITDFYVNKQYEIANLYRQIVKKIHPDVNGESELYNKYWNNIQDSYKSSNLTRLRLFYKLICEDLPYKFPDIRIEEDFLKGQIKQYEKSISIEKQKLSRLQAEEPFCYIEKLSDHKWVKNRKSLISSEIYITEQKIRRNKTVLKNILEKSKDSVSA
jgi:hypothetical protein